MTKQNALMAAAGALTALSLAAGALAFADTATTTSSANTAKTSQHMPGVAGTVAAINGNTVTLTGKDGTTYTVDVSSAAITKEETVTASDIQVGDTLMADGTVSGTTVTATNVHDGKLSEGGFGGRGPGMMGGPGFGRGVHGTVSAINGTTLTITETNSKGNTVNSTTATYTVDASSATVLKGDGTAKPATSTLSAVAVGDNVTISGTISGTSVTAKMIVDGPMPKWDGNRAPPASSTTTTQ